MDSSASTSATDQPPNNVGEFFEWTIYEESLHPPIIIQSGMFYPNGSDLECFLSLKSGGKNLSKELDDPSDLFFSLFVVRKTKKVYGTFEFTMNSSLDSTMMYRNRPCGGYLAAMVPDKTFFSQSDSIGPFGVIIVKWYFDRIYPETEELYASLGKNMCHLLDSGQFSDVDIETQDGSLIPVHQAILSVRAPNLLTMIDEERVETKRKRIKIPDFPMEIVESMLTYIYSGLPRNICDYSILQVAAQKYDLKELYDFCASILQSECSKQLCQDP